MQRTFPRYAPGLTEPMAERVFARLGEFFRAALREVAALRRRQQERRPHRVPDAFAHMDVRTLRDIGAPDWLIDRTTAEREQWQTMVRYLRWPPTL
jgi:hypothetical protein